MSFEGTWNVTINSPMGAQTGTLTLVDSGGAISGQMVSPMGSVDITEGSSDGNHATWKASMTSPMPIDIEFDADVDGDNLSGKVKLGSFGEAEFTGTRA